MTAWRDGTARPAVNGFDGTAAEHVSSKPPMANGW
jgi:hypothetical protein